MALRIMLTAMVVSLSLPLPSVDSCRLLVNEMNQELTTVLGDVRDEWSPRNPNTLEVVISEELAKIGELTIVGSGITEESFSRILDEFATEALRPEIEQAANHARKIPLEQVNHPLPPAVEAIDVLPSALELIRSVSEEKLPAAVASESPQWNEIVSDRMNDQVDAELVIDMAIPVVSDDIGPWMWLEEDLAADPGEPELITEAHTSIDVTAHAADSISVEWDREIRMIAVAEGIPAVEWIATPQPASETVRDHPKPATIQDAFRKTAEAIALWSRVMTRTY